MPNDVIPIEQRSNTCQTFGTLYATYAGDLLSFRAIWQAGTIGGSRLKTSLIGHILGHLVAGAVDT